MGAVAETRVEWNGRDLPVAPNGRGASVTQAGGSPSSAPLVNCVATGGDPRQTRAGELAEGKPVTIGADDSVEEAIATMKEHQVRRLPVIDGHDLVGILSQADIARTYPEDRVGDLVGFISMDT